MKRILIVIVCCMHALFSNIAFADEQEIINTLQDMIDINVQFEQKFHDVVPADSLVKQTPYTTAVLCADSRVSVSSFYVNPEGQIFTIRNIGNQIAQAQGSVIYGAEYLKTPLVLIIGHSRCGAIEAAMSGYVSTFTPLNQELASLTTDPKATLNDNIVMNVNHQVDAAKGQFSDKIASGEIIVIGMVYDLHDDFKYGAGKLIFVNINGVTDPSVIAEKPYVKKLFNATIMGVKP